MFYLQYIFSQINSLYNNFLDIKRWLKISFMTIKTNKIKESSWCIEL